MPRHELSAKYRCLVESIIEQERKLAFAERYADDREAEAVKAREALAFNRASLLEKQAKLAEVEAEIFGLEA